MIGSFTMIKVVLLHGTERVDKFFVCLMPRCVICVLLFTSQ